jgi:broad specificity phosphatase PhoE
MAKGLFYGNSVLNLFRRMHAEGGAVLIVRHSERPSFDGISIEEWDGVGLTERGIEAAREFGAALAREGEGVPLCSYGWGLKRCLDTAEAIAAGAREGGSRISGVRALHFRPPIADRSKYDAALGSGHWAEFVDDWLTGRDQDGALVPSRTFTAGFLRELSDCGLPGSKEISLIVTHDLQIYPLVGFLTGIPIRKLDFLDGPVIKMDGQRVQVGFGDVIHTLGRKEVFG